MKRIVGIIAFVTLSFSSCSHHIHTFDSEIWNYNEEYHWHPATCEHSNEKSDLEEHSFSKTITPPTGQSGGYTTYLCSKCGYSYTTDYNDPVTYTVTWKNWDGTILEVDKNVPYGTTPTYTGETPKRETNNGDGTITKYDFIGWDHEINETYGDTTYVAQFEQNLNVYYEVKFVNYDDSLLYLTNTFSGGSVVYKGDSPTRETEIEGNNIAIYTWNGRDHSLVNITEPTTIKATYSVNAFIGYKVTFEDKDSTVLYSYYCKKGTTAVYPFDEPFSYDQDNVYLFSGWNKSLENISSDLQVTAEYITVNRKQNGEYPQTVITDENLIDKLKNISSTNSKGYIEYNG